MRKWREFRIDIRLFFLHSIFRLQYPSFIFQIGRTVTLLRPEALVSPRAPSLRSCPRAVYDLRRLVLQELPPRNLWRPITHLDSKPSYPPFPSPAPWGHPLCRASAISCSHLCLNTFNIQKYLNYYSFTSHFLHHTVSFLGPELGCLDPQHLA